MKTHQRIFTISALHEAAHAVVGAHFGIPIAAVDIADVASPCSENPNQRIGGTTLVDDDAITARGLWPQALIMIFAGEVAEKKLPNHTLDPCGDDLHLAKELATKYLNISPGELPEFLKDAEQQALKVLENGFIWNRVLDLAAELTAQGRLSATTLAHIQKER